MAQAADRNGADGLVPPPGRSLTYQMECELECEVVEAHFETLQIGNA